MPVDFTRHTATIKLRTYLSTDAGEGAGSERPYSYIYTSFPVKPLSAAILFNGLLGRVCKAYFTSRLPFFLFVLSHQLHNLEPACSLMSLFRRSKTPSLVEGPPSDVKAGRFSFRPGSRRASGAVFDPAAFAASKPNTDGRDNSSLGVERGRALSTLEGARRPLTSSRRPSVNTAFPAAQPESGRSSDEARMRSNMSSPPLGLVPEDTIPSPSGPR
ncbi:hypothetical protein A0H81_01438 [Grifola frondosa]|uniref:Uncharacterized protein n=1 Tax=Grifola frondosa TaxID=5627 RepID=A0A1C7MSX9_GRIFR|nr:hypothetical protein A0H81_01438 [Grifola frondosa]